MRREITCNDPLSVQLPYQDEIMQGRVWPKLCPAAFSTPVIGSADALLKLGAMLVRSNFLYEDFRKCVGLQILMSHILKNSGHNLN